MLSELLHVVLDYILWSTEDRKKHPFRHAFWFFSFWVGVIALVTLAVLRLL